MFKAIKNWYLRRFVMCKCTTPRYEVKDGILHCIDCEKPVEWHK